MNRISPLFVKLLFTFLPLAALWGCGSDSAEAELIPYEVSKVNESQGQTTLDIILNDRTEKESLIAVALNEKIEREVSNQFVCFFRLKGFRGAAAWARVSYLPECEDCQNETDAEGNPVEFKLIGLSKAAADSLKQLTLDSIPNKKYLGGYINDAWKCKAAFYQVENDILVAHLYPSGYNIDTYTLDKDNPGKQQFHNKEGDVHLTYNKEKGLVDFHDSEGQLYESASLQKL